jgi:hypothetical protein
MRLKAVWIKGAMLDRLFGWPSISKPSSANVRFAKPKSTSRWVKDIGPKAGARPTAFNLRCERLIS